MATQLSCAAKREHASAPRWPPFLREIVGYVAKGAGDIDLTRFTSVVLIDPDCKQGPTRWSK